jgi:hypothetical protein
MSSTNPERPCIGQKAVRGRKYTAESEGEYETAPGAGGLISAGRPRPPVRLEIDPNDARSDGLEGGILDAMRVGVAHHLGWAVVVTAAADYKVVDRRRIELIEPGMPTAPIHHEGKPLDDTAAAALVAKVRASAVRATSASLDALAAELPGPIVSMSLRGWPLDFPEDIAVQRRAPYESHADSIMYRQVLAGLARERGWDVEFFNAKDVESQAVRILGERADEVLHGPRATLGPPWNKDHRMALAATIVAG